MSKRFTDTEKYKKPFIRSLDAPYKLLWDYICLDCNHAGIWIVDMEVANIRLGLDLTAEDSLQQFRGKVVSIDSGRKWFIAEFAIFQYGILQENNRVHQSVIQDIKKHGMWDTYKALIRPLQGLKDKDKDKDKDKEGDCKGGFDEFWKVYPRKEGKGAAQKAWKKINPSVALVEKILIAVGNQKQSDQWKKEKGQFIPHPATWLNQSRWEDEPVTTIDPAAGLREKYGLDK